MDQTLSIGVLLLLGPDMAAGIYSLLTFRRDRQFRHGRTPGLRIREHETLPKIWRAFSLSSTGSEESLRSTVSTHPHQYLVYELVLPVALGMKRQLTAYSKP
jgi:hypothetical protein